MLENEDASELDTPSHEAAEDSGVPEKFSKESIALAERLLSAVKTREQEFDTGWWKLGDRAADTYAGDTKAKSDQEDPYNILYSNTEVLVPSLYSATPKPDIRPRFKGLELKPLPQLIERFLTVASDPGQPGFDCFDSAMADAVLSALVPGMGYVRIRYVEEQAFPIVYESGHFRTLIWGKATRWSKVPWLAFKHPMKREQMFSKFKIEKEDQVTEYIPSSESEEDKDDCCVYEIWDKETRKVYFVSEEWRLKLIQEAEDPLGLSGFFPTPGLMLLTAKPGKMQPVPLYNFYKNQAEELNRVSVRLNKVLSAIRVRGAYNSLMGSDLEKILNDTEMENGLVPAAEAALLSQTGGFDKHIWMLPIEKLIIVAQELYKAREAIKQVIYELTGISDIIRGSSVASETATAQDLKAKWGTVRLRKMQKIVADYARDLFRMTVDCSADHVPVEKWKEITQLPIPTAQEQQIAQQQLEYEKQAAMMMPQGMPGQPPQQPPQPNPQLVAQAQGPTMEALLEKIKSDVNRTYVVNIQTSSTVDLDTSQDKTEVSEYMNAMGQLLAGVQPLMMLGPTGIEAAKAMLIAVSQRFKFGIDVGDIIAKIEPPPPAPPETPKGPSPEEMEVIKQEAQVKLAKAAADMQILQAETQLKLAEISSAQQKLGIDIQLAQLKLEAAKATVRAKAQGPTNANVPS